MTANAPESTNDSPWDDLIYSLVYPSFLGSALFDVADPVRFGRLDRWLLFLPLMVFVLDYWHMKNNIKAHKGSRPSFRALDFTISLLFLIGFFSASYALTPEPNKDTLRDNYADWLLGGFTWASLALLLVFVYDIWRFGQAVGRRAKQFASVLFLLASFLFVARPIFIKHEVAWFFFGASLITVMYLLYVLDWKRAYRLLQHGA